MTDEIDIATRFPGITETTVSPSEPFVPPPPPSEPVFEVIRMDDILATAEVIRKKEEADANTLTQIASPDMADLRSRVISWGMGGFQGNCILLQFQINPPPMCSDGVGRSLAEYIAFLSGKQMHEHLADMQKRLPDFQVMYIHLGGGVIQFVATKA